LADNSQPRWTDRDIEIAYRAGFKAALPDADALKVEDSRWHSETRKEIERVRRAEKLASR
jgi:hypothetical protein